MIEVSERAKQELKKILVANTSEPDTCLRLAVNEQGELGLAIDMEKEGDRSVEHEGLKLLLAEEELADTLQGMAIDIEDTAEGARFVMIGES